ncbi:MAG: TetR/AcrR family transcriptional regulator C-terminal domain-containing protein [Clostridia bacterium]|nr:TetR/AcrR family transcriptional regulator C-terminal domain-containing protein [Clostridia bacterium]
MPEANQTKKAFGDALKELLKTQPFEKVTVSSICEQANMKRTSFYYHFLDKYDLVNWIFDTEYEAFLKEAFSVESLEPKGVPKGVTIWDLIRSTAEYFYQNAAFYQNIVSFTGQNSFLDHFRELLAPLLQEMLRDYHKDSTAMEFHINFQSDAILAALVRWLNDPKRVPPDTLIKLLQSCIRVSAEYLDTDFARLP